MSPPPTPAQLGQLRAERDALLGAAAELRAKAQQLKKEGHRTRLIESLETKAREKDHQAHQKNQQLLDLRQMKLF